MPRLLIAIVDTLSRDIATPFVHIYPHVAPAIRMFGDVASQPDSNVGRHIEDYQLEQLGTLDDNLNITEDRQVLITGAQWKAAQAPTTNNTENR